MLNTKLAFADIPTLGKQLRAGKFTCVELTEFFLKRLEKLGPKFNAVVTVARKQALAEANRRDAELKRGKDRGPLHGIPYGAKDLLATSGIRTTWGAAPYKDRVIDEDATVVKMLREAGAILAAKLAMVEIAGGLGYRQANASFTGPGLNPWDTKRWSGGSSSGSGSAVGAGSVPFAIGSETWGSITTPSSMCGIVGLRPTYGRVSRHGAMALSWTMDKLGPMCRTARDCGLVLNAIAGIDPLDPTTVTHAFTFPPKRIKRRGFKLAVLKNATKQVQKEVKAKFESSLTELKKFASIESIDLPKLPYNEVASTLISCEMAAAFEGMVTSGDIWEMTAKEDRHGAHSALLIPAVDYINAMRIRTKMQRDLDTLLARYDAVIAPTLPSVAYPIDKPWNKYRDGISSNDLSAAGNITGIPAITVPNGVGESGLPTGLEFVGRAFEENRLLAIAMAFQSRTKWHLHTPRM